MSISTGVDRLGKVVFWVSLVSVSTTTYLLALGGIDTEIVMLLGALTLLTLKAAFTDYGGAVGRVSFWVSAGFIWYNLAVIAWIINYSPNAGVGLSMVIYVIPIAVGGVIFRIGQYVYRGFATK